MAHPFCVFPSRFTTVGAPSLRFLQGRVRCCLRHVFSVGQHKTVTANVRGARPSHRTRRTGHPFIANAIKLRSLGHPPLGPVLESSS